MAPSRKRNASRMALYVGIDFGTTFSGVAYATSSDGKIPNEHAMNMVRRWPTTPSQMRNTNQAKAPTAIHYGEKDTITWGYAVPDDAVPLQWFKLLLLEERDLPEEYRKSSKITQARAMVEANGKTAIGVVADYLKKLWKHSVIDIHQSLGIDPDTIPIHIVVTVPAIWKQYAQARMIEAVEKAGILQEGLIAAPTLKLVGEPEAAARATLPLFCDRQDLRPGDVFTICDCGGGTVDIISYLVEETEPLVISECVEGNGDLCGAIFLDEAFSAHLKVLVGTQIWNGMSTTDKKRMMTHEWELGIKPCIAANTAGTLNIPMGGHTYTLRNIDMFDCFSEIQAKITALVEGQLRAIKREKSMRVKPKFICLVGGFGRCRYIRDFLIEEDGPCGNITVIQAADETPFSAIARGAVFSGIEGRTLTDRDESGMLIRARRARTSYGWEYDEPYDTDIHSEKDKYFDDTRYEWMATNQLNWIIKRGEEVASVNNTYSYEIKFALGSQGPWQKTYRLYESANHLPPASIGTKRDSEIKLLGKLRLTTPCPLQDLPRAKNNLEDECLVFEYEWRVEANGASLNLTAWSMGKKIGGETLRVCDEPSEADQRDQGSSEQLFVDSSPESSP